LNNANIANPRAAPVQSTTYIVTVSQGTGCFKTDTVEVIVYEPHSPFLGNDTIFCGTPLSWTLDAGTGYGGYLWSTGETSQMIIVSTSFKYSVTVTDQNGCVGQSNEINVIFNPTINSMIVGTDVSSTCTVDGFADLTVTGGTGPYTYFWSTGNTTEDIGPLATGTYWVAITDYNECIITDQVFIAVPAALNLSHNVSDVSCNGVGDGSITISASGGNQPYTFNWSNGENSQNLANLSPGTYTITMTDATGCMISTSATVNEPAVLKATVTGWDITTTSGSDGIADVAITGGIPPFNILWSNGSTAQNINGLTAGIYIASVTDQNGCHSADTVEIVEPFCVPPLNPFTSHATSGSARLNWLPVPGAHHYRIRGRRVGNSGWVSLHIGYTSPSFKNVFGLANNAAFEWQIRAFCDTSDLIYSAWSELDTFETGCFSPDLTFESTVSTHAASLNWSRVVGAMRYEIKGKPVGTLVANVLYAPPSDTFKFVFGLNPATQYEWRVKTWCDTAGVRKSTFTPFNYFTTSSANRLEKPGKQVNAVSTFEMVVFPNPVSEVLNLLVQSGVVSSANVEFISIDGKRLINEEIVIFEGEQRIEVDVSGFYSGIYQLRLTVDGVMRTERIVVNR